jgi:hypothetical protein
VHRLRSWNSDLVCPFVEVLKLRSHLSVCWGLEIQISFVCLSRFWNLDLVCPSVEVLKIRSSVRLSRSWNPDLVCPSVEVLKPRSRMFVRRGLETQIPNWDTQYIPEPPRFEKVSPRTRGPKNYSRLQSHTFTSLLTESRVLSPDQSRSQVSTPRLQITYWGAYGQRAESLKKNLALAERHPSVWNRGSKY